VTAGFDLQIDCPDLAMGRHIQYANLELKEFRKRAAEHIEALNAALANIPADRVRMHLCWGNYEGPHHCDVPLSDIVDVVFKAKPMALSLEAANPRHAHEYAVFETTKLPDGKVLIPGVLESKSNFIEHPEVIANRISNYAKLVGRENVIAGSDCGYGTWVGQAAVDPDIVWSKLAALTEGARPAGPRFLASAGRSHHGAKSQPVSPGALLPVTLHRRRASWRRHDNAGDWISKSEPRARSSGRVRYPTAKAGRSRSSRRGACGLCQSGRLQSGQRRRARCAARIGRHPG